MAAAAELKPEMKGEEREEGIISSAEKLPNENQRPEQKNIRETITNKTPESKKLETVRKLMNHVIKAAGKPKQHSTLPCEPVTTHDNSFFLNHICIEYQTCIEW